MVLCAHYTMLASKSVDAVTNCGGFSYVKKGKVYLIYLARKIRLQSAPQEGAHIQKFPDT